MAATIYEPLSTAHLKSCTVDFDSRPDKKAVNLVQYDQTIPVLCVSLKKGGTEYKVPSDADVNIRMDKRDGYHVYNPALGVNAERTIAYFAVTPQMSTGWGDYYPIVEITVGGGIAGSAPIWLHFDRNPLPENAIISSDEYKTIQQLLEDVTAVKAATEQIKAQTEAVRDQAKEFADNAKNSADKAQTLVDGMPSDYSQAMKDIGTLKNQMQLAYPDNTAPTDATWSGKNIVDMLCPPLEESGNPVVCYPVAGYPLGVKAKWEPVQEGTGTPYPAGGGKQLLDTNKCVPTVGKPYGMTITLDGDVFKVSGVPNEEVTATEFYSFAVCTCSQEELRGKGYKVTAWAIKGKVNSAWGLRTESENSLAIAAELTPGVNNDIQLRLMVSKDTPTAWEPYENIRPMKGRDSVRVERCGENLLAIKPFNKDTYKGITYEYVPDGGIHVSGTALTSVDSPTFPVWFLPPGKYFGLELGPGISASIVVQRNGKNLWLNAKGAFEILAGDVTKYWYAIVRAGATVDKTVYPYIVPGTTAPTTYTPYIGQTNTLTLPETVYGGEVDAVSGEGQETQKLVILNGTESWNSWGINAHNPAITGFYTYDINDYDAKNAKGICSHLENPNQDVWGGRNAGIGFATVGSSRYFMFSMLTSSLPDISAGHEVASLKAYLAAQSDAGTPVQIAYKLAEPVPFTATGAQPLSALAGANTVLTDADSATVTGRADPIKRITDLEDAVASQT